MAIRMKKEARKEQLLALAIEDAKKNGLYHVSRYRLAQVLNITPAAVLFHLGKKEEMRSAIIEYAFRNNVEEIIFEAICSRHPYVDNMSREYKRILFDKFI